MPRYSHPFTRAATAVLRLARGDAGAGVLLIAILDELIRVLVGEVPSYVAAAADRAARGDFSAEV